MSNLFNFIMESTDEYDLPAQVIPYPSQEQMMPKLVDNYPQDAEEEYHSIEEMHSIRIIQNEIEVCNTIIKYKKKNEMDFSFWEEKISQLQTLLEEKSSLNSEEYKRKINDEKLFELGLMSTLPKDIPASVKKRIIKRVGILNDEINELKRCEKEASTDNSYPEEPKQKPKKKVKKAKPKKKVIEKSKEKPKEQPVVNKEKVIVEKQTIIIQQQPMVDNSLWGNYQSSFIPQKRGVLLLDRGLTVRNYTQGDKYIGQCNQNNLDGFGVRYYKGSGTVYRGYWKDDQIGGFGYTATCGGKLLYEGQYSKNTKHGYGIIYYDNGRYEGQFYNGKREGYGIYYWNDGDI